MSGGERKIGHILGEYLKEHGAWIEVSNFVKSANRKTIRTYCYTFMDDLDVYTLDIMLKLGFDINECSDENPAIFDSFYFDSDNVEDA